IFSVDESTQTAAPNNEPSNPPFIRSGHLAAPGFSEHRIYWEEYGSPAGEPVIVMHGGPGAGSHGSSARFFNPQRYRVVLFDQRGCGKSTPSASDDDATPALTDNTTQHLIDDVSALRDELNINGKMHVFGASWGSTLGLAYAIAHPGTVQTLILRGVFLCRRADVDYFFQGNAAEFAADPLAMPMPGAYLDFPTAWRHFVDVIPPEDRGDVVKGLAKAFCAPPRTDAERERLVQALRDAGNNAVNYFITTAGHSSFEPETDTRLRTIMNELPRMTSPETALLQSGEMMRHAEKPSDAVGNFGDDDVGSGLE